MSIIWALAGFTIIGFALFAFYQSQIAKKAQGKGENSSLAADGDPHDKQESAMTTDTDAADPSTLGDGTKTDPKSDDRKAA